MTLNCRLCKQEIEIEIERYVHIEDWNKKDIVKDMWCHLTCYNNSINIQRQGKKIFSRIEGELNKMFGKQEEVYHTT